MKKPSYLLKIENPCGEDWAKMKPDAQGRFCSHCSKTVVNFAEMTDNQVLQIMAQAEGRVCGRFHNDQLNRPMAETKQQKAGGAVQKILAAMLAVSAANYAAAQTPETKTEVVDSVNVSKKDISKNIVEIEGQVVDSINDPVPFATIMIKGTKKGTAADAEGRFTLQVSNRLLASHNILRISSAGYKILEASAYQKKFELKRVGPITVIATAGMVTIIKHDGKDSTTKKKANCTDDIHL